MKYAKVEDWDSGISDCWPIKKALETSLPQLSQGIIFLLWWLNEWSSFTQLKKHLPIKRDDFYFPILISLYTLYSKYMIVLYNLFVIKVVLHYLLGWKFSHINLEVISYPLFVFSKGSRNKITSWNHGWSISCSFDWCYTTHWSMKMLKKHRLVQEHCFEFMFCGHLSKQQTVGPPRATSF